MTIIPIEGEIFRYHVQSDSRPEIQHLVDFEAYHYVGKCSCEHFQFRLAPELDKLSKSQRPDPASEDADVYRCGHLRGAWSEVSRRILTEIMRENRRKEGSVKREDEGW